MFFRAYAGSKILEIVLDVKKRPTLQASGVLFCGATPVASTLFVFAPLFAFLTPCW